MNRVWKLFLRITCTIEQRGPFFEEILCNFEQCDQTCSATAHTHLVYRICLYNGLRRLHFLWYTVDDTSYANNQKNFHHPIGDSGRCHA
jgi:hypothetical protein